jgi:hypothetical protein
MPRLLPIITGIDKNIQAQAATMITRSAMPKASDESIPEVAAIREINRNRSPMATAAISSLDGVHFSVFGLTIAAFRKSLTRRHANTAAVANQYDGPLRAGYEEMTKDVSRTMHCTKVEFFRARRAPPDRSPSPLLLGAAPVSPRPFPPSPSRIPRRPPPFSVLSVGSVVNLFIYIELRHVTADIREFARGLPLGVADVWLSRPEVRVRAADIRRDVADFAHGVAEDRNGYGDK